MGVWGLFKSALRGRGGNSGESALDPSRIHILEQKYQRQRPIAEDFVRAIGELENNKAPGIAGISAEAFKCLDNKNGKQAHFFIVNFWDGKADYREWHAGLGAMVLKKGDPIDPNKWRGINSMDVC